MGRTKDKAVQFDDLRILWFVSTFNRVFGVGPKTIEIAKWFDSKSVTPRITYLKKHGYLRGDLVTLKATKKGHKLVGAPMCKECNQAFSLDGAWPTAQAEYDKLEELKASCV